MNRGLWILILAMVAGAVGFVAARYSRSHAGPGHEMVRELNTRLPELEWLRDELSLNDDQYAKVAELHHAYLPTCEALCTRVMASHRRIKELVEAAGEVSPELERALQDHAALHVECQTAMLAHIYKTAACMSPDQSRHYLDAVILHVIELPMEPEASHKGH